MTTSWSTLVPFPTNIDKLKIKVNELLQIYNDLYKIELSKNKEQKINEAIDRRCADFLNNQKRMIDNIIDREIKTIVLDHVLITDKNTNEQILITNPEQVKKETNKHFQMVAGSTNIIKEIPDNWKGTYELQNDINRDIYLDLMREITEDHWSKSMLSGTYRVHIGYPICIRYV
jgi:hypothetical protein